MLIKGAGNQVPSFLGVEKLKRLSLYTCIQGSKTWMIIRIRNVQNYLAEVLLNSFSTVFFLQLSWHCTVCTVRLVFMLYFGLLLSLLRLVAVTYLLLLLAVEHILLLIL